jgi:hypothetical protein
MQGNHPINSKPHQECTKALSMTTIESQIHDSCLQDQGFQYLKGRSASIKDILRTESFQTLDCLTSLPKTPCTYKLIQALFDSESNKMYLEELHSQATQDETIREFVMSLETNIRQQFIQMIPNLLKNLTSRAYLEDVTERDDPQLKITVAPRFEAEEPANLKMLAKLGIYLSKLLKGEQIRPSEIDLSWIEKVILASIINKKYKHKSIKKIEKVADMTPDFLTQFPLSISQGVSLKRTEENYKIVFNWCFKFLKKRLADRLASAKQKALCKKDLEDYFYNYYFKTVADERNISITKFYKPNFTNKLQNVEKTFNTHFMSHIQLSAIFMADFSEAMLTFVATHLQLIDKKLNSLFVKWEEMLTTEPNTDETLRSISNYIMKSSKCKLPWSRKEIEVAHMTVVKLFK